MKKTTRVNDTRPCAIKIIDKESFWARVAAGKERKDTLVRELTVQAALTHFVTEHHSSFRPVFVELYGVFEKLHVDPGGVLAPLNLEHAGFGLLQLFLCELLRLLVSVVPLVVVKVPLQIPLGHRGAGRIRLLRLILVHPVAVVVIGVSGPVAHANPAEMVVALAARHVVAALVLLNALGALGALLRVDHDPVGSLGLVLVLFVPESQK